MKKMFSAKKVQMLTLMLLCGTTAVMAQNSAGDYSAGTTALATVTEEIAKYVPIMVKLCYAIAGVVAIVGAISVYIAMSVFIYCRKSLEAVTCLEMKKTNRSKVLSILIAFLVLVHCHTCHRSQNHWVR